MPKPKARFPKRKPGLKGRNRVRSDDKQGKGMARKKPVKNLQYFKGRRFWTGCKRLLVYVTELF